MPSTSAKQMRFMQIASHDPAFAKRAGIKVSVAREFNAVDAKPGKKRRMPSRPTPYK